MIALYQGSPVGSVALLPRDDSTLELAKMAVSPAVHGKGIGLALAKFALDRARRMGADRVYLETNTKLGPALSLYRKLGFTELKGAQADSPYERCNVCMEKSIGGHHRSCRHR